MLMAERVVISRRFQRAIRIETDIDDPRSIEGFVCPQSSAIVLKTMARHIDETGQGAFTWTGPYGSGKSSLVVALSALLGGDGYMRWSAATAIGLDTAEIVWNAMPPRAEGWHILPIVGRQERPERLVHEAIKARGLDNFRSPGVWTERQALDSLWEISLRRPESSGGLIVFVDEMGKLLEGAAREGSDVYFLQQLAEMSSRSNGRLVIVGILHQAFEEYSYRLSREVREEWSKIQGRFVDLPVNSGSDEQIALLARAIENDHRPTQTGRLSRRVATLTNRADPSDLAELLENCWPLHPVVSCLLGPISRRRFGQNQRSIFGFLNSSEPGGFQDFLRCAQDSELYTPSLLWDYLRLNLEPSIMASPDGHRWLVAVDALDRCQALGGGDLHLRVLETIALIDLFKERSGLVPSTDLLACVFPQLAAEAISGTLTQLQRWSLIVYRKFSDSYSVFEGSDFNVDEAVGKVLETMEGVDFDQLNSIAGLRPTVAKRHYYKTGAMRWYDAAIAPLADVQSSTANYRPNPGAIGTFLLAVPTSNESIETAQRSARQVVEEVDEWDLVIGLPQEAWKFASLARELLATKQVRDKSAELQGDRIARREIDARIASLSGYFESEIGRAFDSALWYAKGLESKRLNQAQLNGLASRLADRRFNAAPLLQNELLNRVKPSSNAIAAQNALLRRMVLHEGEERLGIEGFPAEGGLFTSLLESSRLYQDTPHGWRFADPSYIVGDPCNLAPMWRAATDLLESNPHRAVTVSEIYDIWRAQPFGVKDGLLPVLTAAFILSQRRNLAFYRQNVFQAKVTDLDMDYLAKDSRDVQLRWMELSERSRQLLSEMASIVRNLDQDNALPNLEPIDVAKGLVSIHDRLKPWVGRTQHLSSNAKRVRQLFKQANDPNKLIFDDIPKLLTEGLEAGQETDLSAVCNSVHEGLVELRQAYPAMLHRLRETLLAELQVPNSSGQMLAELRARAENIRDISGDHRMEAFIMRLAQFYGTDSDIESLAGMSINTPPNSWVDSDIDRVTVELADMARRFMRAESFAHVKGRSDRRHSMAVTVGISGRPSTIHEEFDVGSVERPYVESLAVQLEKTVRDSGEGRRNVILAALAELSALYLDRIDAENSVNGTTEEQAVRFNGR